VLKRDVKLQLTNWEHLPAPLLLAKQRDVANDSRFITNPADQTVASDNDTVGDSWQDSYSAADPEEARLWQEKLQVFSCLVSSSRRRYKLRLCAGRAEVSTNKYVPHEASIYLRLHFGAAVLL